MDFGKKFGGKISDWDNAKIFLKDIVNFQQKSGIPDKDGP